MKPTLLGLAVLLTACTAKWDALVKYSPEPASPGSLETGLYRTYARELRSVWRFDTIYIITPSTVGPRTRNTAVADAAGNGGRTDPIPRYWADTLRREVALAIRSTSEEDSSDAEILMAALRTEGLTPIACAEWPCRLPHLSVGHPGFNRDSTIAALRTIVICGGVCGRGSTTVFARREGRDWNAWRVFVDWLS